MLNNYEILETIEMINHEHLDVRTVTVGISLLDCIGSTVEATADKVYEKVVRYKPSHSDKNFKYIREK